MVTAKPATLAAQAVGQAIYNVKINVAARRNQGRGRRISVDPGEIAGTRQARRASCDDGMDLTSPQLEDID